MRRDFVTGPVHRFAAIPVAVTAGIVAVVHLTLAAVPRSWLDEDLMLAIGRHHLDIGAVDQPPLTPLLARLADTLAPGSQLVLAVPAVLATTAAVVLTALVARELGGDARAQSLAALGQATSIAAAQFGHWLTPYTLEPALWTAFLWLLLRRHRTGDDRLLLAAGLVAGVAAQTRFQVFALGAALVLALLAVGPRNLLVRRAIWAGAGIALLVAAPTLVWQAAHGWPQLGMATAVAQENTAIYGHPVVVAAHGLAVTGPLTLGLAVSGLLALLRDPQWRPLRYLAVAYLLLFIAVLVSTGRHYYLTPIYPVLGAVGAVALQRRRERRGPRRAWPVVTAGAVLATAGAASSVLLASPAFAAPLATTTAATWSALPDEDRARTALVAVPYVHAALLDAAPPDLGLPAVHGTNRAYGWFPPPPDTSDAMLLVGSPDLFRPYFTSARPLRTVTASTPLGTYGGLVEENTTIWLLEDRTVTWQQMWSELRDLSVIGR
ncbi:glycosyltransferase family 39 protein [Pseudonocardia alni]|uniref:4-amino-4-deoxy-L-arabinose transferase-like glycosyltransferase n=1 Tax=Pseudonocardia alni TaxID=33907 RepID=A0A852WG31_PSEA5|nr:glycosyltransferase family 39 protein [Pseudonocardia antarctica]NYG04322.1 4-amino-4-deoxy-L-arabinose transferase-like glycosyltransferase [Pseudonocardia antarctica]